uniref:Spheroidin n=1 Tax=Panagrellus redivivus TaxID=6233 RepID=A0A7E4V208_PANRE
MSRIKIYSNDKTCQSIDVCGDRRMHVDDLNEYFGRSVAALIATKDLQDFVLVPEDDGYFKTHLSIFKYFDKITAIFHPPKANNEWRIFGKAPAANDVIEVKYSELLAQSICLANNNLCDLKLVFHSQNTDKPVKFIEGIRFYLPNLRKPQCYKVLKNKTIPSVDPLFQNFVDLEIHGDFGTTVFVRPECNGILILWKKDAYTLHKFLFTFGKTPYRLPNSPDYYKPAWSGENCDYIKAMFVSTESTTAGLSVSELYKGDQSDIIAWILTISKRNERLVTKQNFAECWEENSEQCKHFKFASPVLRRHCTIQKNTVVLDKRPVDIGGKLFGNIVVLADKGQRYEVPRVAWQPYNVDNIDDWKCLATITTLPSRHCQELDQANVLNKYPIIFDGVTLGDIVVVENRLERCSFYGRNKREFPEVLLQPLDVHNYKEVKIYGNRGKFVYVKPSDDGYLSLECAYFGAYMKVKAIDIIYQNKIDRQMPIAWKGFKEPPWGWEECTFIKAVLVSSIPDGVTSRDYHHALLKTLPCAIFSYDPVTIHCDNHADICVTPGVFSGKIVFCDSFFGHEVEALDIAYKNEIYRLTPISKNTFQEPSCFWHNCVFVKAVLWAPKAKIKRIAFETHIGSVTSNGNFNYFQLDSDFKMGVENERLDVAPQSTWCMKVLIFLSLVIIFIAVYTKLAYFTNSTPEVEVDEEVEVEHSWFSWFVPQPAPAPPPSPKPVKPISHLDSLSEMMDCIWKSFIDAVGP